MRVKELSIGDWVVYTFPKIGKKALKVSSIDEEDNHIGAGGVGASAWSDVSNFEPISLTPEILEKNGFVYSRVTRWYNCELKDTQRTRIGVHYGLIGADRIEISSVDAFDEDWNTIDVMINKPIKGVHQLQHALRLAGVEKKIEL